MSDGKLIVQLHNFSSINLCKEFTKIALGLGARDIIFSKAVGTAATTGVPIAQKMAHSNQANVLYLQEIKDAIELCSPDEIFLFIKNPFAKENFDPVSIAKSYMAGKTVLLVFGGLDPGLTKQELDLGKPVYFGEMNEIGCLGEIAITLYLLRQEVKKEN
jgi:SpoU rRNA methylase family enzyme